MSEQFYTILTNIGKAKIANAISLGSEVNLVRFVVGDSNGSYYNPTEEQTELRRKVWETSAISVVSDEKNPNWIKIEAIIPGDVGGFTVREVGVFDDKNEMIAIGKIAEIYKPISDNGSTKDVIIRIIIEVSNASVVTIKVDPTVMIATKKDIEVVESKFKKITGDKNELVTKNKSNLVAAINEVATDLNNIELTGNKVTIEDTDNNFVSGTVEGALKELATKDKDLDKRIDDNKTEVDEEIADLKQHGSDVKEGFATVITSKGVTTDSSDTFETMINNVGSIKTKLPILEGDVGVTEDSEGNVYGVGKIEERQIYTTSNKITEVLTSSITPTFLFWNNNYLIGGSEVTLYKYDEDFNKIWSMPDSTYGYTYKSVNMYNEIAVGQAYRTGTQKVSKIIDGEIIWELNVSSVHAIGIDDKGFIYYGSRNIIYKLDSEGNLIWSYSYSSSDYYAQSINIDKNGNVYASFNYISSGILIKISSDGEKLSQRQGVLAIPDSEDNLIVIVRNSSYSYHYIEKYNKMDELLWTYKGALHSASNVTCPTTNIAVDNYGSIYAGSNSTGNIIKVSKYGDLMFSEQSYPNTTSVTAITVDNKGNIYTGANKAITKKIKDNYILEKVAVLKEREVQ